MLASDKVNCHYHGEKRDYLQSAWNVHSGCRHEQTGEAASHLQEKLPSRIQREAEIQEYEGASEPGKKEVGERWKVRRGNEV